MRWPVLLILLACGGTARNPDEPATQPGQAVGEEAIEPAAPVSRWWCYARSDGGHSVCVDTHKACEEERRQFKKQYGDTEWQCTASDLAFCMRSRLPDGREFSQCTEEIGQCRSLVDQERLSGSRVKEDCHSIPEDAEYDGTPWWCVQDSTGTIGGCFRDVLSCDKMVSAMSAKGFPVVGCHSEVQAACYAIKNPRPGYDFLYICSPTMGMCQNERSAPGNGTSPIVVAKECEWIK